MNPHPAPRPLPEPYFHDDSGTVRFWVRTEAGDAVGASIARQVLHHRFKAAIGGVDALDSYLEHRATVDAAVLRRVARGSIEPVMVREHDLA